MGFASYDNLNFIWLGYYNGYNDVDDVSDDADVGGVGENNDDDVEVRVKARSALFGSTRPLWTAMTSWSVAIITIIIIIIRPWPAILPSTR